MNDDVQKNVTGESLFVDTSSIILSFLDLIYLFWINKPLLRHQMTPK